MKPLQQLEKKMHKDISKLQKRVMTKGYIKNLGEKEFNNFSRLSFERFSDGSITYSEMCDINDNYLKLLRSI